MAPPELVVTGLLSWGLAGPLISGPGGAGALAIQDSVARRLRWVEQSSAGIVNALYLGRSRQATLLNGLLRPTAAAFGPNLNPLLVHNQSPLPLIRGLKGKGTV